MVMDRILQSVTHSSDQMSPYGRFDVKILATLPSKYMVLILPYSDFWKAIKERSHSPNHDFPKLVLIWRTFMVFDKISHF